MQVKTWPDSRDFPDTEATRLGNNLDIPNGDEQQLREGFASGLLPIHATACLWIFFPDCESILDLHSGKSGRAIVIVPETALKQ